MKLTRLLLSLALVLALFPRVSLAQELKSSAPTGGETGMITRNIPSGTQVISGSVTANPSIAATVDTASVGISADTTLEAATANLRLQGWTIRESDAAPAVATVVLRHDADGTCDSTNVFSFIELGANQSVQMWYGDKGLGAASGVCADILAGTVDVNIFTTAE